MDSTVDIRTYIKNFDKERDSDSLYSGYFGSIRDKQMICQIG